MGKELKLGRHHYDLLNRIKLYGSVCAVGFNETRMVQTTLTRLGLVTIEKVGERTLKVRITEAGMAVVSDSDGGHRVVEEGANLGGGCHRHFPKRNA